MLKLFYNATFHTMDPDRKVVNAVLVIDGIIAGAGDYTSMLELASSMDTAAGIPDAGGHGAGDPERVDLLEAHVLPGFIDLYSGPGITAFCREAREEMDPEESCSWVREAVDFLLDKGVTVLPLPIKGTSLFRESVGITDSSLIYDYNGTLPFEEDLYEGYYDGILSSPGHSLLLFIPLFDHVETTHDAIAALTTGAAEILGAMDLGSIKKGKRANFTIYRKDDNPFVMNFRNFSRSHVSKVIIGGEEVYDEEDAAMAEMYSLLASQAF